ncbi:glycosyltransferase [Candidatus Atribacteria bacterium 1244-E10-H5-B2]|nr:MAG: glycosyltransferase [Candidatus Atribacteria bacterium 1244-E10-H5-B2]
MLPVIASNVGGVPEIIENGRDGILVPSENPEALARVINNLLEDDELREKLSQAAYKKVKEKYSIDRYSRNILNLYKKLLI